jgi:cytochrome c556
MRGRAGEIVITVQVFALGRRAVSRKMSMNRAASMTLAIAFLVFGAGVAITQSDPIAARKALMKENNENALVVVRMMRGQMPFDPVKVDAAFAQWEDTAKRFSGLFPGNSQIGQETRASSKIWITKADFDAKAAEFGKVVAENRVKAKTSLAGLRIAIPPIGNACDNCHKEYRTSRR